jgi:hypothetical protein
MIERVAKAIYERGSTHLKPWDQADDGFREFYRITARAAIEAMLEPSNEMIDRAIAAWANLYPGFEGEKPQPTAGDVAATIHKAMIEAALQEQTP